MDDSLAAIIAAVISGAVAIAAAVIASVSARTEPRRLRELKALNDIIEKLDVGSPERAALERRRANVAIQASTAGYRSVDDQLLTWGASGGTIAAVGFIFIVLQTQTLDPGITYTVVVILIATLGLSTSLVAFLALFGISAFRVVQAIRAWRRREMVIPPVADPQPGSIAD